VGDVDGGVEGAFALELSAEEQEIFETPSHERRNT
jgi:hypothetical protein